MSAPRIPGTEVDYWHVLTPEERRYLQQFNDELTRGYFRKGRKPLHSRKQKKQIQNRDRHASRRDAYAKAQRCTYSESFSGIGEPKLEDALDSLNAKLSDYLGKPKP